jgi:hypothetical protein
MKFFGKAFGAAAVAATIAAAAPVAVNAATIDLRTFSPGAKTNLTKTFTYVAPAAGKLSVYLSSVQTGPQTNVDFSSAKLNGTSLTTDSTGISELRSLLAIPVTAGESFNLLVTSTSQKLGSYSVSFVFAVPEPATWALMILGFGAVAYSMRRRVATNGKLALA